MPLLFVSLFLLYLKLNYVEKVMKREIGNGFCDGELLRTVGKIDSNSRSNSNLTQLYPFGSVRKQKYLVIIYFFVHMYPLLEHFHVFAHSHSLPGSGSGKILDTPKK